MKERPILFSAPMVRAILEGRKTQTRRVVKPVGNDGGFVILDNGKVWWPFRSDNGESAFHTVNRGGKLYLDETPHSCPYGQTGDLLWVRETFSGPHYQEGYAPSLWHEVDDIWYWADGNPESGDWTRPRPSIHMPSWASRILLKIVSVRIERLADISKDDAMAEGIVIQPDGGFGLADSTHYNFVDPTYSYCSLWESINGAGSWMENPWVWVVEFKRVAP